MLVVFAALIPTLLVAYATPPDGLRAARVVALGEALALAEAVTMILKAAAGRPRPVTLTIGYRYPPTASNMLNTLPARHAGTAAIAGGH